MSEELHPSVKHLLERPTTEDDKIQELLRASFTRARLTEAERTVSRGVVLQETARANLEAAISDGNEEQAQLERWHLADALAMTGEYEQAAALHPVAEEQVRLSAIAEAIERDDAELCDCRPIKTKLNDVDIEVPQSHVAQMIFSKRHGEMVGLEVCACGEANARPVAEVAKGRPDTEVLKAEKHE